MIDIVLDSSKLDFALARLANAAKVDLGLVIKEEARYIVKTIIQFTPPKSQQQGAGAIRKDIGKMSAVLDYQTLKAKATKGSIYESMARMVRRRETEKLNLLLRNPKIDYWGGRRVLANITEVAAVHQQAGTRNKYGRIKHDQNVAGYRSDLKRYRDYVETRVGWHIAGWIPAAKATGAKYKKFADKFSNHAGVQFSSFGKNPYITAINKKVKIPFYQKDIDAVIASRTRTTLTKIDRILANKAVNLGFTKIDGAGRIEKVAA